MSMEWHYSWRRSDAVASTHLFRLGHKAIKRVGCLPRHSRGIIPYMICWIHLSSSKRDARLVLLIEFRLLSVTVRNKIPSFSKLWHRIDFEVTHNTVSARNQSKSFCSRETWFLYYNNMLLSLVGSEAEITPRYCRWSWPKMSFSAGSVRRLMLSFLLHIQWWILTLKCFMEGRSLTYV